jgi:DNA transposition AAA+ family ATPase
MSDTEMEEISAEDQEAVRAEVRRVAGGTSMTVVAKQAGIPYGTFSAWIGGTYTGNNGRIAQAARRWLHAQATGTAARAAMPVAPGYIETPTAKAFFSALEFAQFTPDFVVVSGGAGVGKTTTVGRYKATHPNVTVLTCEPAFQTPRMMLDRLAMQLGMTEKYRSQMLSFAIQRRLAGTEALVVLDEAQHLRSDAMDQLRTLHDLTGVGFALVGNETVYGRIEGHAREAQFSQLYSRVGMRVSKPTCQKGDISAILDAWEIEGADERKMLTAIASKPGALRGMTKTLRLAVFLSRGEPVTAEKIRMAWQRISSTNLIAE